MKHNDINGLCLESGLYPISDDFGSWDPAGRRAGDRILSFSEIRCADAFVESLDSLDEQECKLAAWILVDECGDLGLDEAVFSIDHAIQRSLPHWSTGRCLWLMERFLYWIRSQDHISQLRLRQLTSLIDTAREQLNYPGYKCMPKAA